MNRDIGNFYLCGFSVIMGHGCFNMRANGQRIKKKPTSPESRRVQILFKGIVQGVGFRPFLYRAAKRFALSGFVKNTAQGVILEVEGEKIDDFIRTVIEQPPPLSRIENYRVKDIKPLFSKKFEIVSSESDDFVDLLVSPDIAICGNCRKELFSPADRRFGYPFINCTDCGPRLTIIRSLPYDRPGTTMKVFDMCPACGKEYTDPLDRRYHAQPVSCFDCGPVLSLIRDGRLEKADPLDEAIRKLKQGSILAVKGLGGYHLACRVFSDRAIARLRKLKKRKSKPFALMGTLEMIDRHCLVSETEKEYLCSPSAPILLLERRDDSTISGLVAPGQNRIGFMIPYTPLHLLLISRMGEPLVMTSANFSGEPILYRDDFELLSGLSDLILAHNRDIQCFADDSVACVFDKKLVMVRRSRGFVPLPVDLPLPVSRNVLALGAMLKTTFTIMFKDRAIVSQYIGNTDSPVSVEAERILIKHYQKLFSFFPETVVMDKHPDYPNRLLAGEYPESEIVEIQHHRAHVGALLAENKELGKIIGISMDGTGFGDDGKIWGGECFVGDYCSLSRFGHLRYYLLPSGEQSIKEPWRFALSLLAALYGGRGYTLRFAERFRSRGLRVLESIRKNVGGIMTSSCGRLFDAVSSILGVGDFSSYDGELPSRLQALAEKSNRSDVRYPYSLEKGEDGYVLDLLPAIEDIINDTREKADRAFSFHLTLAGGLADMARRARDVTGIEKAGLTGGVFQNMLLLELTRDVLQKSGFQVLIHSRVPSNDGGISLGQAFLAAAGDMKES
jgi:hydrogenase maturation protein HypF